MENDLSQGINDEIKQRISNRLPNYLSLEALDRSILAAFAEDLGTADDSSAQDGDLVNFQNGDITTNRTVPAAAAGSGHLIAKQKGILAGTTVATRVSQLFDASLRIDWLREDGNVVEEGDLVARIHGSLRSILTAERTMLNFIQRMSGIATATNVFVGLLDNTKTRVLDTRKTAPGLRLLDKWAVKIGGGVNHRLGLFDEVMVKDNHIAAAGGLSNALIKIHGGERPSSDPRSAPRNTRANVVVEASSLAQVREILAVGGVDRILLDNMVDLREGAAPDVSRLQAAVKLVDRKILTEASGNITFDTARIIAETGVDFISIGALTHSVAALDVSLLIEPVHSA